MSMSHHLDDATLIAFAAGTPDEAIRVVIASHLAMCPECRDKQRVAEQLGAVVLDEIEPSTLDADAFNNVLEKLDDDELSKPDLSEAPEQPPAREDGIPAVLSRYLGGNIRDIAWKRAVPGVSIYDIPLSKTATGSLKLFRIAAGKSVPEHSHSGSETTLVLRGHFTDDFGTFGPGDISELDDDATHAPMIGGSEECICLVAIDGPLRFKGVLSRALQPLIGL